MKRLIYLSRFLLIASASFLQTVAAQSPALSLADCRKMALEQNKKIQSAQYEIEAAKAASEAAKLNDRPNIDASLMGVHAGSPLNKLLPSVLGNASLDIKQPVYAGGKIALGKKAYSKAVEIYQGKKAVTEEEVLLAVETAYWQVVQVKEKVLLAHKYKEMLLALRNDLKNAFDAGLTYKNDLLRVEVSLNEAELNITKANDGLVMAKLNLAQVTGQPNNSDFTVTDSVSGTFTPLSGTAMDASFSNRPEINLLKKAIEAQELQTSIIKAEMKPTVGIALSGVSAVGKKVNFTNGNNYMFTYYGLVNVSIPIFDWGRNAKKVKEQKLLIQSQELQLSETKELISLQVQNAFLQLNQSAKNINLSKLSLQQAEENLRLANDRYKAGTTVGKDVLEAQVIWQQAYTNLIDAKIDYKINEANYKKATDGLK
ncbi:MAG: TolC family protein [Chitinophagaceae bacterium]|nr:TolC family protein [Chitinophagaceae bacterium]